MDKQVRALVWERSKGFCEKCGKPLDAESWDFHHRLAKKHGGKDSCENGLAVHHECHIQHRLSIHQNPREARAMGWIVSAYVGIPLVACPLRLPSGVPVFLTRDGKYEACATGVIITDGIRF